MNPYFFFSYAHGEDTAYFDRFYDDLRKEVAEVTKRDAHGVGFRDTTDIGLGRSWRSELVQALSTCECFVPVLAPRLLDSPYCGKEWQLFQNRIDAGEPPGPSQPSRLLPVLWRPLDGDLPEVLRKYQRMHGDLGAAYHENGLLKLIKLGKFRDEYEEFLSKFATMMKDAVAAAKLPPVTEPIDMDAVPDAFHQARPQPSPQVPRETTLRHVLLVVAAGAEPDLKKVRHEVSAYGHSWLTWRPFPQPCGETAIVAAQAVVSGLGLSSTPLQFDDTVVAQLEEIHQLEESDKGRIFVILLDPWSAAVSPYEKSLRWFDKQRFLSGAVLEVWQDDTETKQRSSDLYAQVKKAIPALYGTGTSTSLFRVVADKATFGEELIRVVSAIQGRLIEKWQDPRVAGGETAVLPQVQGPVVRP